MGGADQAPSPSPPNGSHPPSGPDPPPGARSGPRYYTGSVGVGAVDATNELARGRKSYARREWMNAYESLSRADRAAPLGAEDLELLATAAYMLGRDDDHLGGLERAYHEYLDAGKALLAARCAIWVGMHLSIRGEMGRATGWLGRAQRRRAGLSAVPAYVSV